MGRVRWGEIVWLTYMYNRFSLVLVDSRVGSIAVQFSCLIAGSVHWLRY